MATGIFIVGTFNFILAKLSCYVAIQLDILSKNSYELLCRLLLEQDKNCNLRAGNETKIDLS